LGITGHLSAFAAVEEFALKIFHKHARDQMALKLPHAPRALLQIFITNTFNHRLLGFVVCNFTLRTLLIRKVLNVLV
jgi:hypothetical protein